MSSYTFSLDMLFAMASTDKPKRWQIHVRDNNDGTSTIIREHGYVNQKIQVIEKIIRKGKNIGKANGTNHYTQAIADAKSLHQKQVDKGYVTNLKDWKEPEFPMLAHPFEKRKHKIKYPCYVQRKFNGVRCFAKRVSESEMTYMSRGGKFYDTLDHLTPLFLEVLEVGDIVDGEIYIHGVTFQEIIRRVKKLRPESITLQFHAYDFIPLGNPKVKYNTRKDILEGKFKNKYPEIVVCETLQVANEEEIKHYHDLWVMDGYEGIIIRNSNGHYSFSNRSVDLQKYKEFIDDEFKIVGGTQATESTHAGCVKFICDAKNGETFSVYPKGTLEERRQMFIDLDKYIGKELTVRYQETSEAGTPIFGVGICIRDYE